jgi:protein SCO1/2
VADFFFTSCGGICPTMTQRMKLIQDAYPNDEHVMLISHSVTPVDDSVSVLRQYAEENGINYPQWRLVTGDKKEIYTLARHSYFADEDLGEQVSENDFLHSELFLLIDVNKRIRGVYNGTSTLDVQRLIGDIATLKSEIR